MTPSTALALKLDNKPAQAMSTGTKRFINNPQVFMFGS
jgi:hypothetical protein